jgi:hypothetical protein
MSVVAQLRMEKAKLQREYEDMDVIARCHMSEVTELLFPHIEKVTALKIDEAKDKMDRLWENIHKMIDLEKRISKIDKELNAGL